jgi:hypothetical protein
MSRIPKVTPWNAMQQKVSYDLFIAAVGFEKRARYIAESLVIHASYRYACAFPDRKTHHYGENLDWFTRAGYIVNEVPDCEFGFWCRTVLDAIRPNAFQTRRICIDVSSLNRFRIAVLIDSIRNLDWEAQIDVAFLYSLAQFSPPPREASPNRHVGPVMPSFSGWTLEPDRPPVAVVGLGYEEDKALGAVEHIQAASVWTFLPESINDPYMDAVRRANKTLLETIPPAQQLTYPVHRPFDSFVLLESLVQRIVRSNSPVLLPFGPKMFSVCAMLVACLYPSSSVWRVSAGPEGEAVDRVPTGSVYGLQAEFLTPHSKIKPDTEYQLSVPF